MPRLQCGSKFTASAVETRCGLMFLHSTLEQPFCSGNIFRLTSLWALKTTWERSRNNIGLESDGDSTGEPAFANAGSPIADIVSNQTTRESSRTGAKALAESPVPVTSYLTRWRLHLFTIK
jgi:hypothetical protein